MENHDDLDPRLSAGLGGRFYGVYSAVVVDLADPEGQGRVRVRLPWSPDPGGTGYAAWARLTTLMAGADRGSWFLPDVDDEVLVAFDAGDPRRPFVLGALWNGRNLPPETMDEGSENQRKVIRTRSGVRLSLDDSPGAELLELETPGGHRIALRDSGSEVEIVAANGDQVMLNTSGISVTAGSRVAIEAATVEVAAGSVTVNAGMAQFSGVVQCSTLIATSVVGTSYTPGAGNIW
jgi:uncharacterized protein involved in type VI secretion and phage assembly